MSTTLPPELDGTLETLIQQYGYPQVLDHLVQVSGRLDRHQAPPRLTARQILVLPLEERNRLLQASVEAALPEYEADRALPPDQRILTADRETGDGLSDGKQLLNVGVNLGYNKDAHPWRLRKEQSGSRGSGKPE